MPTVNKPFGLADPQYDALRVFSNQALEAGPGDGTSGGGGLENKIYLWPADGSTITTYDPDQAGLIAALAAAVSGDTVWIPSVTIALTAGVTVPAGVALVGISEKAALSFSGFSGTAITLGADAVLLNFSVSMVSNGTDAIGVFAGVSNAVVSQMVVTASGGTSLNIAIDTGSSGSSAASAMWFRANQFIYYSDDPKDVGGPTFTQIAVPSGVYDGKTLTACVGFGAASDGSAIYTRHYGAFSPTYIMVSTNPPVAPTWSILIDSSGSYTAGAYGAITYIGDMHVAGNILWARVFTDGSPNRATGKYDGGVWTWYSGDNAQWGAYYLSPHIGHSAFFNGATMYDFLGASYGVETLTSIYMGLSNFRTSSAGVGYAVRAGGIPGHDYIHRFDTSADLYDAIINPTPSNGHAQDWRVYTTIDGVQCYAIDPDGLFYISENGDGATMVTRASWAGGAQGEIADMSKSIGDWLWWLAPTATGGGDILRKSSNRGATFSNAPGNFWSLTSGNQALSDLYFIF